VAHLGRTVKSDEYLSAARDVCQIEVSTKLVNDESGWNYMAEKFEFTAQSIIQANAIDRRECEFCGRLLTLQTKGVRRCDMPGLCTQRSSCRKLSYVRLRIGDSRPLIRSFLIVDEGMYCDTILQMIPPLRAFGRTHGYEMESFHFEQFGQHLPVQAGEWKDTG